jgi:hypothetical protein
MDLIITARSATRGDAEYGPLEGQGLSAAAGTGPGDGSPERPRLTRLCIANEGASAWSGVIRIELPFQKASPRFFLPGFIYGRNRGEAPLRTVHEFPRVREGSADRPASPWWMARGDRLTHPIALAYDAGRVVGLCASPYLVNDGGSKRQWAPGVAGEFLQFCGYTCDIARGTVGYTLGYENAPWSFIQATRVLDRAPLGENCLELAPGEAVELDLELFDYRARSELGVNAAIERAYRRFHQAPRPSGRSPRRAVADLAGALSRDAWLPEDLSYSGQVFELPGGGYRYNKIISTSWTNGLSVATPMLMAALRLGDGKMREQALACIGNIVANSTNPSSGLPYDAYSDGEWSVSGWWFDGLPVPGHSSYVVGQALFYVLKAYDFERRLAGAEHVDWLEFARRALERLDRTRSADGEYPYILSERTGSGLEYDSFSGAWCLAATAYYCSLSGDHSLLGGALSAEGRYYDAYVRRMECYGTPLDTDKAVDSEGIIAYIKALRFLHGLTGDPTMLLRMGEAFRYEFSFKFCYNAPVRVPPLRDIGWSSCGGSVTSTANPHIHPMASNLVDELAYYARHAGDAYAGDRLADTLGWGCQTYNTRDGEYGYGKEGWMSERFCYSEGFVTERYPDGSPASTWFCLMPWASSCVIEGLAGDYWEDEASRVARGPGK